MSHHYSIISAALGMSSRGWKITWRDPSLARLDLGFLAQAGEALLCCQPAPSCPQLASVQVAIRSQVVPLGSPCLHWEELAELSQLQFSVL